MYKWTIYKIINPKGRIYIGKTNNFKKRLGDYRNVNCSNQKLVYKSLKKYGFQNHKIEIIEEFESGVEYCNGKEMFWIRSNMSNIYKYPKQNGLNLTDGGCGRTGCKQSEETKKKLSDYFKANPVKAKYRPLTQEEKEKRAESFKRTWDLKGRKRDIPKIRIPRGHSIKGRRLSPNTEFKMGVTPWNKGTKGVMVAWNKGKDYSHLTAEERKLKFDHNSGKKYPNKKPNSREALNRMAETKKKRIVICDLTKNTTKEYSSIKEAVEIGYSSGSIWGQLSGKVKRPKKFTVKYAA